MENSSTLRLFVCFARYVLSSSADQYDNLDSNDIVQERHSAGDDSQDKKQLGGRVVSKWRQKEKLKTTAVALVLCLNIGVDPPDVIKISPCARLECWVDPMSMQPAKALETIGKD
jgi:regulator-associated protein of mTOR